ncbi:hypothetical protein [Microbacterium sp. KNMS]
MRPLRTVLATLGVASTLVLVGCVPSPEGGEDFTDWAQRMEHALQDPDGRGGGGGDGPGTVTLVSVPPGPQEIVGACAGAESVSVRVSTPEAGLVLDMVCGTTASGAITVPDGAEVVLDVDDTEAMWWVGLNPPASG